MDDGTLGERIYAIGDVHGRLDLLEEMFGRIEDDLGARPHRAPRVMMLGDYVDRGPDSRGVIDRLLALEAGPVAATFLLGNHDAALLDFLDDPEGLGAGIPWLHAGMGGAATMASYGVPDARPEAPLLSYGAFADAFPAAHRAFLERCRLMDRRGGYVFVHAGVRPGVPFERQVREDLIWIREPFLGTREAFGAKVVHGHTIVPEVEHRPNRIAVDTGAVKTGVLSCVVLEGTAAALLLAGGPRPLPEGAGVGTARGGGLVARLGRLWPRGARPRRMARPVPAHLAAPRRPR